MIMPPRKEPRSDPHVFSEAFLNELRRAVMSRAGDEQMLGALTDAVVLEFPEDFEMRHFVKKNLYDLAKLACELPGGIGVRRNPGGGMEIFTGK